MSNGDMWEAKPTKAELLHEITYLLYRLQQLGEEPDRIRAYRDKIEQMLEEI
jgi:hypothetical protein